MVEMFFFLNWVLNTWVFIVSQLILPCLIDKQYFTYLIPNKTFLNLYMHIDMCKIKGEKNPGAIQIKI